MEHEDNAQPKICQNMKKKIKSLEESISIKDKKIKI